MSDANGSSESSLPPVTILIEWENAIDVDDEWAASAMAAFEAELERLSNRFEQKPRVIYLYDEGAVEESTIRGVIEQVAPKLPELCDLEVVATPGLTYYKLKNYGVAQTKTDFVVMLDSDAGPKPGWLEGLLAPFEDPEVMAVGGFTVLGWDETLLSKMMALSWIMNLPSEREQTLRRKKIHANNCAFRTDFFRANPFPEIPGAFKKACGFWLRDIDSRGFKWVRTADAMCIHAPQPGGKFLLWRAWTTGTDRDVLAYHTVTKSRIGRLAYCFYFFGNKVGRSWLRIWTKGGEVDLPVWRRPLAMAYSLYFFSAAFVGELWSAATRSFEELPRGGTQQPILADG